MRNLTLTITGAFLLSLLFVASSFASEAVIPNPTQGLQPAWGTEYGYTESDTLKQGGMYHPEYGLQPAWGTESESTESDVKHGTMYRPDYGLQPFGSSDYTGQPTFGLEPYTER